MLGNNADQWGTIGFALPSVEVKVFRVDPSDINKKEECPRAKDIFSAKDEEQGEICFRSRNTMMGYLANPKFGAEHVAEIQKKNADAVDAEGWLHSGDMGAISQQGMVKITGRYKELIITAGGENVAPVPIEDELKRLCPAIANAMLIGDKRKFNVVLVTLKAEGATGELPGGDTLEGAAATAFPGITTITAAMKSKGYTGMIEKAIAATNKNGKVCPSNASKIQKFMILPIDWSVSTGELTATLKLKRGTVMTKFESAIDSMYESSETYVAFPTSK
jgi:long-chain-fatty-acid--CoA ligase ACSBG